MLSFWIIIEDLEETEAKRLYIKHQEKNINVTVLPNKVYINGEVTQSKFDSILDDVIELSKEYTVSIKEIT